MTLNLRSGLLHCLLFTSVKIFTFWQFEIWMTHQISTVPVHSMVRRLHEGPAQRNLPLSHRTAPVHSTPPSHRPRARSPSAQGTHPEGRKVKTIGPQQMFWKVKITLKRADFLSCTLTHNKILTSQRGGLWTTVWGISAPPGGRRGQAEGRWTHPPA